MKAVSRRTILLIIAAVLVLSLSMGLTAAYFSDYEGAKGGAMLHLGEKDEIKEEVDNDQKSVSIANIGETRVIVRVAIYGPAAMTVTNSGEWVKSGDFYYYTKVLEPGAETEGTLIANTGDYPAGTDLGSQYQIIVVQECKQVTYDSSNNIVTPDGWATINYAE
ncbi:MAG: hypothetical protein IJH77_06660 [Mogibacterium sp.]|nr:hypothetical protein [Mogibacterium sp.]